VPPNAALERLLTISALSGRDLLSERFRAKDHSHTHAH